MRLILFVALLAALVAVDVAAARVPPLYRNCTSLNKRYPHGLGKTTARDKTAGVPFRNFFKSNRLFAIANSYNHGLDRDHDHDGIACEKH